MNSPASVDNSAHMPPVRAQGSQASCVGWAFGYYYKTYQEWQEHGWDTIAEHRQFSPAFQELFKLFDAGIEEGHQLLVQFRQMQRLVKQLSGNKRQRGLVAERAPSTGLAKAAQVSAGFGEMRQQTCGPCAKMNGRDALLA